MSRNLVEAGDRFRSGPVRDEYPEVLKAAEVAALLRVDRKTLYEAVQRDEIPGVVRLGRVLRFSRDAIFDWLERSSVLAS